MRNALYSGPATIWLKDAAQGYQFRTSTGGGLDPKTMRDREAINRFCGFFLLNWKNYKGDMDTFLADTLKHMNSLAGNTLVDLRKIFDSSMKINRDLFGIHAFRKSLANTSSRRQVLNIALFDVASVLLGRHGFALLTHSNGNDRVRQTMTRLLGDQIFSKAITYSTNSTQAVLTRFGLAEIAIQESLRP
jgi:hypothetical protein